jgi:hypothetical protein
MKHVAGNEVWYVGEELPAPRILLKANRGKNMESVDNPLNPNPLRVDAKPRS